jgi:hypothetical protein
VPDLAERLASYASAPNGWAVVPTELLREAVPRVTLADVVIPTKSNVEGVRHLLDVLPRDPAVGNVIVVGDGEGVAPIHVPRGAGIHVMWNVGMSLADPRRHVLFLNDDVTVNADTVSGLVRCMTQFPEVGLVCPNYSGTSIAGNYREVADTCRGRYDGSGGMAGFAMMLRNTLAADWRFDERMMWWYGDDDVLAWVRSRGHRAVITPWSTCADNESWTILHDPPVGFAEAVANDARLFEEKWRAR